MSEYIAQAGYTNLEEYTKDKAEYILHHTDFTIKQEKIVTSNVILPFIVKRKPAFLWMIENNGNYAFVPTNFNKYDKLAKYNINAVKMGYDAKNGIIITSNGDLRICILIDYSLNIDIDYFLFKCKDYLEQFFDNVKLDNNDILINDKKVIGSATIHKNNMKCFMFQISYNNNYDIIRDICGKSVKEPGYIDMNIIPQEKLKDEFIKWLQFFEVMYYINR